MAALNYSNYEWALNKDLSEFAGKWVAIVNRQVVAVSYNAKKAQMEAKKKYPAAIPFLKKVPLKALSIL